MKKFLPATLLLTSFGVHSLAQVEKANHFNILKDESKDTVKRFNLHFQTTYIYQYKPQMTSPYESTNSLIGKEEKENSLTATMYLSIRLWKGAKVFVNPEIAGGSGLSGALGMAGSSNGETTRVGNPAPTLYLGRGYLEQTIALSKETEVQQDDANQLGGYEPKDYLRFTVGKYAMGDLFDNNAYANTPRTQFMNWALMNNGAWDFAANVRGYTYAFAAEVQKSNWNYKAAIATLPKVANGAELNTDLSQAYSLNAEIGKAYKWHGKDGNIRVLGYLNNADMGSYKQAISSSSLTDTPDVTATRQNGRTKTGFGISFDQVLNKNLGLFARLGWNDGKNESWAFTEIDQTASVGLNLDGNMWHRVDDYAGVALLVNGISKDHRDYLAAGGYGFIIGDSKLNYAPEGVLEMYYNFKPTAYPIWFSGDYQLCINPAYNKDRGPANIFSFRVHVQL
ncbi:carbohydrate porin [Taibaiella soli]|uniref:Carbohydrate porin n=1 Tax=Taibaiella soli TaxID=1649169 RepID=A0A2W2BSZ3_9BACT|nr:carbohydrate porin [Taibaiella soli]PZF70873.1 carbohydrate porin [Taibaiella soli]